MGRGPIIGEKPAGNRDYAYRQPADGEKPPGQKYRQHNNAERHRRDPSAP